MDHKDTKSMDRIRALFDTESLSILSTQKNGQPYASLVAFATTHDLGQIFFLTPNTTRKYDNLIASPRVAMLVNNSRNLAEDIYNAISVTAIGRAATCEGEQKERLLALYLKRHPHLKSFSCSPTTAMVSMTVRRYIMVSRFQNVVEIRMAP